MHKHLLKKSVTAALMAGGLVGLAAQPVHADSLLFPYLNTDAGTFSFVTIANEGLNEFATLTGYRLNYGHKPNPVNNTNGCTDFDFTVNSTPGDVMTFEVNGKVTEPNGVLFEGGAAAPVTSVVPFSLVAGQTAFLGVTPIGTNGAAEMPTRIELWGWAEVISTSTNMTLAYSTHNTGVNGSVNPNFALSDVGNTWHRWSWYPTAMVTTSWYVLPLGPLQTMLGGGIRTLVQGTNGIGLGGAWDRDERFVSAGRIGILRCLGFLTRADVLTPGAVAATNDGGYLYAESFGATVVAGDTYNGNQQLNYRVQTATAATGLAPRTAINREPALNPAYAVTLDAGP